MMKRKIEMEIKNPYAAGIDIGSKSHFVAVGQNLEEVKEFGIYHSDHQAMVDFLKSHSIKTIAMESTGSYWQSLYLMLIENNFDVLLVPGSQTKGFRKTDVKDARHLQQLHSLGILTSCFLPDDITYKIRELVRHRKSMIKDAARYSGRMQKCLRLMNLRLDVVISDITGVTGMRIIRAILGGERDCATLASLADSRVKKSRQIIADALVGNFKSELMYQLRDNLDLYEMVERKIAQVDNEITELGETIVLSNMKGNIEEASLAKKQLKGKNQSRVPIQKICFQLYGTDISAIPGISVNTLLTIVSEVGTSINKFATSKSFTSWLRLAPNNKISGGRVLSSRTPKSSNPLTLALRDAANVIGNQKKGELTAFFKRLAFKKGRCAAITATARKLAAIIYQMITTSKPYDPLINENIKRKMEAKKLENAKKIIIKNGFFVIDNQGVVMS